MNILPDDIYREILSFVGPDITKYKFSVIWCNKCGEILKNGSWYIAMGQCQANTYISYTCPLCSNHNVYFEANDWMTLLDYIDQYDTP
mgnify:FL=1